MKVPVDIVGLALLVIGVSALQFMLDNGNEKDWFHSGEILAAAVIGVVAISFLIPWELTDKHPIIDLQLFRAAISASVRPPSPSPISPSPA